MPGATTNSSQAVYHGFAFDFIENGAIFECRVLNRFRNPSPATTIGGFSL
jgi:hypothetical protein